MVCQVKVYGGRGASNYELWLAAGNTGTLQQFLDQQTEAASAARDAAIDARDDAIEARDASIAASTSAIPKTLAAEQTLLPRQDLFRYDRATVGKRIDTASGNPVTISGWFYTHRIALGTVGTIWLSLPIGGSLWVSWYNAAGAYISSTTASTAAYAPISAPANTASFVVSATSVPFGDAYAVTINPDLKIFDFDPSGARPRGYGRLLSHADLNRWTGKKIAILGDSRVKNDVYNWFKRVCRDVGATVGLPDVNGRSDTSRAGRRLAKALFRADDTTALGASDFADIALTLVQIGCNDAAAGGLPYIGSITDSAATDSLYGQLRRITSTLIGWNNRMRIALVTPFYRTDVPQTTTRAYADAFIAFGRHFGFPVFDHCQESGINEYNASIYLDSGGIHQNEGNAAANNGYDFGNVNQYTDFLRYRISPPTPAVPYESVP